MNIRAFKGVVVIKEIKEEKKTQQVGLIVEEQKTTSKGTVISAGENEQDIKTGDIVSFIPQRTIEVDVDGEKLLVIQENALLYKYTN